jgi:site-specific DNA recombinase
VLNPHIEGVVQVDVRQQRRNHRPLRSALYRRVSPPIFDHARFEPFTDQANDPLIGDPVFQKPEHPPVIDFVEERADVGIHNPVHLSALDSSP